MASNFPATIMGYYTPDRVRYFPVTAGQTFIAGALVVLSSGAVSECGANPASILGIALAPASMGLDSRGSIFGSTNIPVLVLRDQDTVFMGSSTTPVFATHVGNQYGITKSTNWLVNIGDTTNKRVNVVDVANSPAQEGFYVRFKQSVLQGEYA